MRKKFQGVANVVRFNWHFYAFSALLIIIFFIASQFLNSPLKTILLFGCGSAFLITLISLIATFYVYDWSGFYDLNWIKEKNLQGKIVNINAGFDETSKLLKEKFPQAKLIVFDFYNPAKHTEISIERARKAFPAHPQTQTISTDTLPLTDNSVESVFMIFSAHEIRCNAERDIFFKELNRILQWEGKVYIVEHLRDWANFFAYTIGFFHFHGKETWLKNFQAGNFILEKEKKITPFVSVFTIKKNGNST